MNILLNEKLKKIRKELKLTQKYVASVLNVNRTAITSIEKGRRKITTDELKAFSELYGVTTDELLHNKKIDEDTKAFVKTFSKLSDLDKKEILNIIELKKR